jgi:SAM-dependent methyltransferase
MLSKTHQILTYARENGIQATAKKLIGKVGVIFKLSLKKVTGFEDWHVSSFTDRPYAESVVNFLNSRSQRISIVEVGCGLGDILRHLDYKERLGLDRSPEVLRAARVLTKISMRRRRPTTFQLFDFLADDLLGKFDAIVLVNWIHEIEPIALKEAIARLFTKNLRTGGVIIFDVLDSPTYRFSHSADEISRNLHCRIAPVGDFDFSRRIFSLERLSGPK